MDELVKAVKDHAQANYDKGWDVVVVCWTDPEIAEEFAGATDGDLHKIIKAHLDEYIQAALEGQG